MCGIAGIVGEGASAHAELLNRVLQQMRFRGPDDSNIYISPSGQCVLGHRRLSILDLSPASAQPMLSVDNNYAISYNGECYNYPLLKKTMEAVGEVFVSSGDTEVVLRLLMRKGVEALPEFNGMFALSLWNENTKTLLLCRDRFGQKPLYYVKTDGLFLFASELRALLVTGLIPKKLNMNALSSYLSFGAVLGPECIVEGVELLEAASFLAYEVKGSQKRGRYWTPPRDKIQADSDELSEKFQAAVSRHFLSDVPVALFLSGGIDSSAIAVSAAKDKTLDLHSITLTFPEDPNSLERENSRKIANLIGSSHNEIPVRYDDMRQNLEAAISALDQPTIDGINTYFVSGVAKDLGLKVAISGLGGDELFGGYPSFRDLPRLMKLKSLGLDLITKPLSIFSEKQNKVRRLEKLLSALESPNSVYELYMARRELLSRRQIAEICPDTSSSLGNASSSKEYLKALISERELPDAIGLLEMQIYLQNMLLRDSDVMGMAHSLEIRAPFLDTEFAEYCLRLPAAVRTPKHNAKWFLSETFVKQIPASVLAAPKSGFALPFDHWLQGSLKTELEEVFNSLCQKGSCLSETALFEVLKTFRNKPREVGWTRIWSLYILGRYLEKNGISA